MSLQNQQIERRGEGGEEPEGRKGCWGQNVLIPGPRGGERPEDFQIPAQIS